jgi:hypothetical protein
MIREIVNTMTISPNNVGGIHSIRRNASTRMRIRLSAFHLDPPDVLGVADRTEADALGVLCEGAVEFSVINKDPGRIFI